MQFNLKYEEPVEWKMLMKRGRKDDENVGYLRTYTAIDSTTLSSLMILEEY